MLRRLILILFVASIATPVVGQPKPGPVDIGSRVEMFVDDWLVEAKQGVEQRLQSPQRREVVLTMDRPWEDETAAYYTVFQDGPKIRVYYRGIGTDNDDPNQPTCYAESTDGIHFIKPALGLLDYKGSKDNNIVYLGAESSAFSPFLDTNPNAKADEKYKAVGYGLQGGKGVLFAFASPDGLRWKKIQSKPIMPPGTFDSQNVAFWDSTIAAYRCYSRHWVGGDYSGVRGIQHATSADFLHWSVAEPNRYVRPATENLYTNATTPCPGAPHVLLSFPMRFFEGRKKDPSHKYPGVSDAMFMTSRNGTDWDRTFGEAWLRPGRDPKNWTQRSNMPAWGVVQTAPDEFSIYVNEHYTWPDNRLRRLTVRRHGFASMHAGAEPGGEFTTRPIRFTGKHLVLNFATAALGSVRVEIQDVDGKPLPGFSLADAEVLYGDELDAVASWKGGADVSRAAAGKPIRLRVVMLDADLYALRFGE